MNWDAVGAVGQLLGTAAVVASLLWVARQVQASNRIAQADAYRAAQLKMAELVSSWSDDPAWMTLFVEIRYRGLRREQMTPTQSTRAGFRLQALLTHYSAIHRDVTLGILPESAYEIQAEQVFRTPFMRQLWPVLREDHSSDFIRFMEQRFELDGSAVHPTGFHVAPVLSPNHVKPTAWPQAALGL